MSIICWFFFKINEVLGNYHDLRWKSRKRYINVFAIGFKFQINNNIFISTYFSEVKIMWNVAEKSIYYHNYYLFIYHFKFPTLSLWWLNTYHVECNSEFICHFVKKMTWVFSKLFVMFSLSHFCHFTVLNSCHIHTHIFFVFRLP